MEDTLTCWGAVSRLASRGMTGLLVAFSLSASKTFGCLSFIVCLSYSLCPASRMLHCWAVCCGQANLEQACRSPCGDDCPLPHLDSCSERDPPMLSGSLSSCSGLGGSSFPSQGHCCAFRRCCCSSKLQVSTIWAWPSWPMHYTGRCRSHQDMID